MMSAHRGDLQQLNSYDVVEEMETEIAMTSLDKNKKSTILCPGDRGCVYDHSLGDRETGCSRCDAFRAGRSVAGTRLQSAPDYSKEIAWFVTHRKRDVQTVIRDYKKLTRGRRGEFGIGAALFVSALEAELESRRIDSSIGAPVKRLKTNKRSRSKSSQRVSK